VNINAISIIGTRILQLLLLHITFVGYIASFSYFCSEKSLKSNLVNATKCPMNITLLKFVWVTGVTLNYENVNYSCCFYNLAFVASGVKRINLTYSSCSVFVV
jgi:hypothetical protein